LRKIPDSAISPSTQITGEIFQVGGDGQTLHLGSRTLEAIHVPRHSPGSLVYLVASEDLRVLFGQEVHGPLARRLRSNRTDL